MLSVHLRPSSGIHRGRGCTRAERPRRRWGVLATTVSLTDLKVLKRVSAIPT
jgi:hypothetical protein